MIMKKLLIRQLPKCFTQDDTIRLLKHFDATEVFVFPAKGKMRNCAFATFIDDHSTSIALTNLHQMYLDGTRLIVEYAKDKDNSSEICSKEFNKEEFFSKLNNKPSLQNTESFVQNNGPSQQSNLISSQHFSSVISQINLKLSSNKKFYNQVLDLMHKMNIPFEMAEKQTDLIKSYHCKSIQCDLVTSFQSKDHQPIDAQPIVKDSPEDTNNKAQKRKIKKSIEEACKRLKSKTELSSKSAKRSIELVTDYFDNYVDLKRVDSKLKEINQIPLAKEIELMDLAVEMETSGSFGKFTNQKENIESKSETTQSYTTDSSDLIKIQSTSHSIFEKQLTQEELANNPVFKNYSIGKSSCRLYLKNVDKKVTEQDIRKYYVKLLDLRSESDLHAFDVNLFKKGKMNGQAFLTLPTEEYARLAIEKTHGLMLNRKPICVCYARSIKPKE